MPDLPDSELSERELLVLRAVRACGSGGGVEEDIWQAASRLGGWPGDRGVPLTLGSYLRGLAVRGLLDRQQWPYPVGSYRPPAAGYALTGRGEGVVEERFPRAENEPASESAWYRAREGARATYPRVARVRELGGRVQYRPDGMPSTRTLPADEFEAMYVREG